MKVLLLALTCCALVACGESLTQEDKDLFVRPADFAGFNIRFENPEALETFSKARPADGVHELTHTFTAAEGSAHNLYLQTSINITRGESGAATSDAAGKVALLAALRKDGVVEREVPGVKAGRLILLVKNGRPIGNVFTVREGGKSYLLVMTGVFFQHAEPWNKLIEPKMQHLKRYAPEMKSG